MLERFETEGSGTFRAVNMGPSGWGSSSFGFLVCAKMKVKHSRSMGRRLKM